MTSAVERVTAPPAVALPLAVTQTTAVEQSRAAAEVHAAVVVAQQCPRSIQTALAEMRRSCQQKHLADRAFYRYNRGDGTVSGPSVHLARELARCWGNVDYGIAELKRDDDAGNSEMKAFAWDLQTNTRNSSTFQVPHKRDRKTGPVVLTDLRDIYENNANQGARRVREAIYAILPPWFVEEAKELCQRTLDHGGGIPLPTRIGNCIDGFADIGITKDQLEQKIGRPADDWIPQDVAQLGIVFSSIKRGEIHADDEFPPPMVTAEEIVEQTSVPPATDSAPADEPAPEPTETADEPADQPTPGTITPAQRRDLHAALSGIGITRQIPRLRWLTEHTGRQITATDHLTQDEARDAIAAALKARGVPTAPTLGEANEP